MSSFSEGWRRRARQLGLPHSVSRRSAGIDRFARARHGLISVEKRIRNRRDHAYAVRLAVQAVNALFEAGGGGGLHLSSGIQRNWRDVNAVAHHISLNWDVVSAMYGQHYLGLEPKGQY